MSHKYSMGQLVHATAAHFADRTSGTYEIIRLMPEDSTGERGYRIRDVGSLNGTYVNRVRVDAVDLRNGDEIQVGKYRFKFVFA